MNSVQRRVAPILVIALAAIVLFLPRNVPFGNKYPFVFGNSLALRASIDLQQVLIEVVLVAVVGVGLYLILGRRR
jgi:hypothetical protein